MVEEAFKTQTTLSDLFKVKANFKALLYTCFLVSFQQFTGINVVLIYAEGIFKSTGTSLSTSLSTIIVGIVQMLASGVTPLVVERLGRRILLVVSGVGVAVTLVSSILIKFELKLTKAACKSGDNILFRYRELGEGRIPYPYISMSIDETLNIAKLSVMHTENQGQLR